MHQRKAQVHASGLQADGVGGVNGVVAYVIDNGAAVEAGIHAHEQFQPVQAQGQHVRTEGSDVAVINRHALLAQVEAAHADDETEGIERYITRGYQGFRSEVN